MGKFSSRWLVALALGGTLLSGAAQADWAGTLKSASDALNSNNSNTAAGGSNTAATGSGGLSLGTLTGLLNGGDNGLKAESATNAAGVLEYCAKNDIALLPGVLTPTDVAVSLEYGFKTMKLFPAGSMPMSYLKDLKGPFDDTHYMAIGGVNPQNIRQFFDAGYLSVGLASSLMPKDAVAANDWETCEAYVRDLVSRIGRI